MEKMFEASVYDTSASRQAFGGAALRVKKSFTTQAEAAAWAKAGAAGIARERAASASTWNVTANQLSVESGGSGIKLRYQVAVEGDVTPGAHHDPAADQRRNPPAKPPPSRHPANVCGRRAR